MVKMMESPCDSQQVAAGSIHSPFSAISDGAGAPAAGHVNLPQPPIILTVLFSDQSHTIVAATAKTGEPQGSQGRFGKGVNPAFDP